MPPLLMITRRKNNNDDQQHHNGDATDRSNDEEIIGSEKGHGFVRKNDVNINDSEHNTTTMKPYKLPFSKKNGMA